MWKPLRDRSAWFLRYRPYFQKEVITHSVSNVELATFYKTGAMFVIRSVIYFRKLTVFVLLTQYCAGDKMEKNEMGWACGAYG